VALVTEKVIACIAESLNLSAEDLKLKTKLVDIADSLEVAQLVLDLEQDFKIEITDDELGHIFTIQDIVSYVDSHSHAN
jgi:acyl carrier protein